MKLFQKSALAVAIAAVPFLSVNAMEALDDAALSEMTGQAGVTIETTVSETGITIGSIEYTDTASDGPSVGGGSLVIDGDIDGDNTNYGIKITGAELVGGAWQDAAVVTKQTIDIDSDGNLRTATTNVSGTSQRTRVGNVRLQADGQTTGASLVSNLDMIVTSVDSTADIINLKNTGTNGYSGGGTTYAAIETQISDNVKVYDGSGNVDTAASAAAVDKAQVAIRTSSKSKIENLDVDALGGAVAVRGLKYYDSNAADGLMDSSQTIWAVGGEAAQGGGVYIAGSASTGTLEIGALHIGGSIDAGTGAVTGGNIGSIKISNISQAGSVTRIYGH